MGYSKKAAKNQVALYGDEYQTKDGNWLPGMDAHKIREVCQRLFALSAEMRHTQPIVDAYEFDLLHNFANELDQITNRILIDLKPEDTSSGVA